MNDKGIVYLVGAGPGDPGLITVKGLDCIRKADAIVYDRLASPDLLRFARPDAERIYVGKASNRHAKTQDEINQILVDLASQGKVVTRLKGGDPYLYGRGGEEAEILVDHGLAFEVVPGVTSAISVPAYAGIPVTHRDFTASFAVITGHEDPTKEDSNIAWDKIATGIGTLVFLMGVENLPKITSQLMKYGRSPETPVALVRWGTRAQQETITGNLADIAEKVEKANFKAPAVTIVGEVVGLREKLRWFDSRPLFGKRVLVTRSREQASDLSSLLGDLGAEPVEFPVIETQPPADFQEIDSAISRLDSFDWIIFTSVNGVKSVVDRLFETGKDVRAFGKAKLCAIGPATANELKHNSLRVELMPKKYVAESVLEEIGDVSGKRILLPRADIAREVLPEQLRARGAQVEEIVAYRTVLAQPSNGDVKKMFEQKEIDMVTFTSSSTVRNFVSLAKGADLEGVRVACIGPITAQTANEAGLKVDILTDEYTIPGLVAAILEFYQKKGD